MRDCPTCGGSGEIQSCPRHIFSAGCDCRGVCERCPDCSDCSDDSDGDAPLETAEREGERGAGAGDPGEGGTGADAGAVADGGVLAGAVLMGAEGDRALSADEWQPSPPAVEQVRACEWWWIRGTDGRRNPEPSRFRVTDYGCGSSEWVEMECGEEWLVPREGLTNADGCEFKPCHPDASRPTHGTSRPESGESVEALMREVRADRWDDGAFPCDEETLRAAFARLVGGGR